MGRSALGRWLARSPSMEGLNPGSFAFVMATGIISVALDAVGAPVASGVLLLIGLFGYAVLLAAYGWRLARWRDALVADLVGPRGFAFLTLVAASDVLASRLASDRRVTAAAVLLAIGAVGWVLLGYGIPLGLITSARRRPALDQVNGTWFIWIIGTQSVAVAAGTLARSADGVALGALASVCWAMGLVQYLLTAALVLARLLLRPVAPADIIPPTWVFMGAAAISVLGGTGLLRLPAGGGLLPRPFITGVCLVLWSFGAWLIPLLLALGFWRHVLRRMPLRYEAGLWSVVFPMGMYAVATRELGHVTGASWLTTVGAGEAWAAVAVWVLVFAAMVWASVRGVSGVGVR